MDRQFLDERRIADRYDSDRSSHVVIDSQFTRGFHVAVHSVCSFCRPVVGGSFGTPPPVTCDRIANGLKITRKLIEKVTEHFGFTPGCLVVGLVDAFHYRVLQSGVERQAFNLFGQFFSACGHE
jgi:hypothetical protein